VIVGPSFVWLHFPKTAGHTVDLAIRVAAKHTRGFMFDRRGDYHPGWHDILSERAERDPGFDPADKVVVSGFRRLPHWILSKVHYDAGRLPFRVPPRDLFRLGRFFEADGSVSAADLYAARYRDDVHRWVRVEHIRSDFERCFGDVISPKMMRLALAGLEQVRNASAMAYLQHPEFYFSPQELADLYAANPVWSALEEQLYGGLLTL
jgi:hypothetical protein